MKVLITGAAGMLGSGLVPAFVAAGHEVVATDINLGRIDPFGAEGPQVQHLDVRDRSAVDAACDAIAPDLICHLAAETSLEVSEDDPEHAFLTNTLGTKFTVLAAARREVPLVYISTAGVFDGEKDDAYHEWDDANPINVYGRSKYEGEKYVEQWLDRYYIVRAGWMVGGGALDHKFVARIVQQVREGREVVYAVGDTFGTPTYVPDFADCLLGLLGSESWGRYHMACEGEGSRFDVAREILQVLGRENDIDLVEVDSGYFKDEFPAPRPRSEIMRNLHLELQGLNTMRPWRVALRDYLETYFAEMLRTGGTK
jgi:dTDP-4-dehydrorhamnose reductase